MAFLLGPVLVNLGLPLSNRHYFYRLKGEYAIASTPKGGWFRSRPSSTQAQAADEVPRSGHYPSSLPRVYVKKPKKQIILSQSMVIDTDPNKVGRLRTMMSVFLTLHTTDRKATRLKW
jgi:hypothetical protein